MSGSGTVSGTAASPLLTPARNISGTYDVAVAGSGAAGLVAAVRAADAGLRVLVAEKAPLLGGTTAAGGGVMWAPNNHLARQSGYRDSHEDGVAYLTEAAGRVLTRKEVEWYVSTAPRAVAYLDAETRLSLTPIARPDYHMEWQGAADGGRGLDNDAFDPSGRANPQKILPRGSRCGEMQRVPEGAWV